MSCSTDATVKIWDLRKGRLSYTLYGHNGTTTSACFSHYGDYFCSGVYIIIYYKGK